VASISCHSVTQTYCKAILHLPSGTPARISVHRTKVI
jgi:hypothetical protein